MKIKHIHERSGFIIRSVTIESGIEHLPEIVFYEVIDDNGILHSMYATDGDGNTINDEKIVDEACRFVEQANPFNDTFF